MEDQVTETLSTLLKELQMYGTADCIVGKEIHIGEITIVPVTRISVGVGAGGGARDKKPEERSGSGGGGGVKVEPVAFLVIQGGDRVSLFNIRKKGPLDTISEQVPCLINKWIDKQTAAGKGNDKKNNDKKSHEENPGGCS